jgi:hypothetical protein
MRSRRSTAAKLLRDKPIKRAPKLPDREGAWHSQTRKWWASVWASPMRAEYVEADIDGLQRLALLIEDYWTAEDARTRVAVSAEIRLLGRNFGLSPMDRRSLDWSLTGEAPAKPKRRRKAKPAADPRQILKAVK